MNSISLLGDIFHSWVAKLSYLRSNDYLNTTRANEDTLSPLNIATTYAKPNERKNVDLLSEGAMSNSSGDLEFLDALDVIDDNASDWFEENWVADEESVTINDTSRPEVRYRKSSFSDTSSVSLASLKSVKATVGKGYLSAENLARLDEGDDYQSRDSENNSFHSALSIGGQEKLANSLHCDILLSERQLKDMRDMIKKESMKCSEKSIVARRRRKKQLKLQLVRAEAELRALRAVHLDLMADIIKTKQADTGSLHISHPTQGKETSFPEARQIVVIHESSAAIRAMEIMKSREEDHHLLKEDHVTTTHNLFHGLNRDLFLGSIVISKLSFKILDGQENVATISFSNIRFQLHHKTFNNLYYFSILRVTGKSGLDHSNFFIAGSICSDDIDTLTIKYPYFLSSSNSANPFLRTTIDIRHSERGRGHLKSKISIGVIDVIPHKKDLCCFADFALCVKKEFQRTKKLYYKNENLQYSKSKTKVEQTIKDMSTDKKSSSSAILESVKIFFLGSRVKEGKDNYGTIDVSFQLGGFFLCLSDEEKLPVGAICITGFSTAFAFSISPFLYTHRGQVDMSVSNVQVLHLSNGAAKEIFGSKDIFHHLLHFRTRLQLVNDTEEGGWVTDDAESNNQKVVIMNDEHIGINLHSSITIQSICTTVLVLPFKHIVCSLSSLMTIAKKDYASQQVSQNSLCIDDCISSKSDDTEIFGHIPIRFRFDFVIKKLSIVFPIEKHSICANFTCDINSAMREYSPSKQNFALVGNQEFSIFRSSDNWMILEPLSVFFDVSAPFEYLSKKRIFAPSGIYRQLYLSKTSISEGHPSLKNIVDPIDNLSYEEEEKKISVAIFAASLRVNVSSQVLCLIRELVDEIKSAQYKDMTHTTVRIKNEIPKNRNSVKRKNILALGLSIPLTYLILHKDTTHQGKIPAQNPQATVKIESFHVIFFQKFTKTVLKIRSSRFALIDTMYQPGIMAVQGTANDTISQKMIMIEVEVICKEEGNVSVELSMTFGHTQLLILPSLVKSFSEVDLYLKETLRKKTIPSKVTDSKSSKTINLRDWRMRLSIHFKGVELLIPAKDIYEMIRSRSTSLISVITLRFKSSFSGTILINHNQVIELDYSTNASSFDCLQEDFSMKEHSSEVVDFWKSFWKIVDKNQTKNKQFCSLLLSQINWSVSNCQILRTSMRRITVSESMILGMDSSVCCFITQPPAAGEQQIVSPFNFSMLHSLTETMYRTATKVGNYSKVDGISKISHCLQIELSLIDLLMYARQGSEGGINEALRVSINPIRSLLKEKNNRVKGLQSKDHDDLSETQQSSSLNATSLSFLKSLKSSTFVTYIFANGIQVTLVPGGATRLTEAPIMKGSVLELKIGLTILPKPSESMHSSSVMPEIELILPKLSETDSLSSMPEIKLTNISTLDEASTSILGAFWIHCDISAYYHNRSIVTWEPLLERWALRAQCGLNLSDLGMGYCRYHDLSIQNATRKHLISYGNNYSTHDLQKLRECLNVLYFSNISHVMLYRMHNKCLDQAMLPSHRKGLVSGGNEEEWLSLHGFPGIFNDSQVFSVSISDCKPLNINISGAFIDITRDYISNELQVQNRKDILAPHWIKNESGLPISFREVLLDPERIKPGEENVTSTLKNGSEIALSLKRNISQSCNPHQAYIALRIGDLNESVVDTSHQIQSCFREISVPVDIVGVYQFQLLSNGKERLNSDNQGVAVVIRVVLHKGIKVRICEYFYVLLYIIMHNLTILFYHAN